MKRFALSAFLPLISLFGQAPSPHQQATQSGWIRHAFKLGATTISLESPPQLSDTQDDEPILMDKIELGGQGLRQPGEPITTGIALFQGTFDIEGSFGWQGVLSSLQVVLFLGQLEPGARVPDTAAFQQQLTGEYRAFLESGNAEARAKGLAPRFRILEDFQPTQLGGLATVRVRLIQDGQENLIHFLPLGPTHYLAITCRILEDIHAQKKRREKGLDKARALAEKILGTLRQTPGRVLPR